MSALCQAVPIDLRPGRLVQREIPHLGMAQTSQSNRWFARCPPPTCDILQAALARAVGEIVAARTSKGLKLRRSPAGRATTLSIKINYRSRGSIDLKWRWNLVRDQEVDGSNPLAPTILFNEISAPPGFSSTP